MFELLVATTYDGWIGLPSGELPFRQKADLQRFKAMTEGHVVVMGRKTFESIGRLLPGRVNVVVSRQPHKHQVELGDKPGTQKLNVSSLAELAALRTNGGYGERKWFIIGGAEIYRQALRELNIGVVHITRVQTTLPHASEADGWARFDLGAGWAKVETSKQYPATSGNQFPYHFEAHVPV